MGEWLGMILQRIGQAIFWIVEACGILLISLSVVLLFCYAREAQIRDVASIQSCNVLGRFAFASLRKCSKNS